MKIRKPPEHFDMLKYIMVKGICQSPNDEKALSNGSSQVGHVET